MPVCWEFSVSDNMCPKSNTAFLLCEDFETVLVVNVEHNISTLNSTQLAAIWLL